MIPTMTRTRGKVIEEVQGLKFGKVAVIAVMTLAMVTLTNAAFVGVLYLLARTASTSRSR